MLSQLMPTILNIMSQADVVRTSRGDLRTVFGTTDADSVYHSVISSRCKHFVCTRGADAVTVFTGKGKEDQDGEYHRSRRQLQCWIHL